MRRFQFCCFELALELQLLLFELRGVLSEPLGWNLRNRVAHGLVTADECYAPASLMLWWLVVRFCLFPLVAQATEQPAPAPDAPEQQ